MATIAHDSSIEWPNGKGWTPCSSEYQRTMDERDLIHTPGHSEMTADELPPDLYNRWHQLDDKLGELRLRGHVGKSERY